MVTGLHIPSECRRRGRKPYNSLNVRKTSKISFNTSVKFCRASHYSINNPGFLIVWPTLFAILRCTVAPLPKLPLFVCEDLAESRMVRLAKICYQGDISHCFFLGVIYDAIYAPSKRSCGLCNARCMVAFLDALLPLRTGMAPMTEQKIFMRHENFRLRQSFSGFWAEKYTHSKSKSTLMYSSIF